MAVSLASLFLLVCGVQSSHADSTHPRVSLETNLGTIVIELYPDKAPATVKNFLAYVDAGFFAGTIFHRVIKGFMIQGGGFGEDMQPKPTQKPILNEANNGLLNLRGTIAMARTSQPHSATSQFFINTKDNQFLNHKDKTSQGWGYCVFGKVVEGMDVVDAIESQKTTSRAGYQDVPDHPVTIVKAEQITLSPQEVH